MKLTETIESEQADIAHLNRLSDKYPNDAELQRIVNKLLAGRSERLKNLYELLNYREKDGEQ